MARLPGPAEALPSSGPLAERRDGLSPPVTRDATLPLCPVVPARRSPGRRGAEPRLGPGRRAWRTCRPGGGRGRRVLLRQNAARRPERTDPAEMQRGCQQAPGHGHGRCCARNAVRTRGARGPSSLPRSCRQVTPRKWVPRPLSPLVLLGVRCPWEGEFQDEGPSPQCPRQGWARGGAVSAGTAGSLLDGAGGAAARRVLFREQPCWRRVLAPGTTEHARPRGAGCFPGSLAASSLGRGAGGRAGGECGPSRREGTGFAGRGEESHG